MATGLLKSRKFMLMLADALFTLVSYFVSKYAGLSSDDWLKIIGVMQPVIISVIVGITLEDSAKLAAGVHPSQHVPPFVDAAPEDK